MAALTIEQIAKLAQISPTTVSRVLNNHPNVRPAVRERVLQVIHEQGYVPRAAAQSLAKRRTQVIGLLIPVGGTDNFTDPFFGPLIQEITVASTRAGYFVVLSMITPDMERGFYERVLRSRHLDGVIMFSGDIDDPILPLLIKDKTPLVLIGSHPYFQNLSWVTTAQREGGRRAVAHLIGLGHRRVATITGPLHTVAGMDRRDGYKQSLLEAGLPIRAEHMVEGDWTWQGGFDAMRRLLSLPEPPTAVFVASDTMATGAMHAIAQAGRAIPSDIALVSFDDLPSASFANPPLSTIRQPIAEMSRIAVKLLVDQIERGEVRYEHICLPNELIVRGSCGSTQSSFSATFGSVPSAE
ncbi:MAG TPA: LacI family DNA-binding transcriptional regulator [Herpetosiphonaceae bacterium]